MTLGDVVFDIGGGVSGDRPLKALQAGGASRGCIPPSMLDLAIDTEDHGCPVDGVVEADLAVEELDTHLKKRTPASRPCASATAPYSR